jgi:hypothetical protein
MYLELTSTIILWWFWHKSYIFLNAEIFKIIIIIKEQLFVKVNQEYFENIVFFEMES